ncbi:MAG: hypothetical protein ACRDSJ_10565, partial [Rubrobacteraceae bacterium]
EIDGGGIWRCRLRHVSEDVYYCPVGHEFVSEMAKGRFMAINVGKWVERISLKGSNSAMRKAAEECSGGPIIEPDHYIDL